MATNVEICNLANLHLGVDKDIASLTENSKEARVYNKLFNTVLDEVLRDHKWGFATKFAALAEVAENPTDEWGYSYRYPTDCLLIRRIMNNVQINNLDASNNYSYQNALAVLPVAFIIGADASGLLIYSNLEDAEVEYTYRATDGLRYPPDFIMAMSYKLAGYAGPSLAAGDPFKLAATAMQKYVVQIEKAAASSANEEQVLMTHESGLSRARI